MKTSLYRCKHCGKTREEPSDKAWVKSVCDPSGCKTVHMMKVPKSSKKG